MIHNGLAYGGPLSKAAAVAVGLGREEEGLSRLSETLGIELDLWSEHLPEFAWHRNERLWGNGPDSAVSAVAAQNSVVGVRNPANSNQIVVVERLSTDAASCEVRIGPNTDFVPATISTPVSRDTRLVPINNCRTQSFRSNVAVVTGARVFFFGNTTNQWLDIMVALTPGFYCMAVNPTVNTALNACFMGRERPALPGEIPGT